VKALVHDRALHEAQRILARHDTTHSLRNQYREIVALLVVAFMAGYERGQKEARRG
jgi:hypothetical protein